MIDGARKQKSRISAASVMPGEWHVPSKPHSAFFGTHCPGDTGLSETRGDSRVKRVSLLMPHAVQTYCSQVAFVLFKSIYIYFTIFLCARRAGIGGR